MLYVPKFVYFQCCKIGKSHPRLAGKALYLLRLLINSLCLKMTDSRKRDHNHPNSMFPALVASPIFINKALSNQAPKYLSDLIITHNPSRSLRARDQHLSSVLRSRLKGRGDRAFAVAGPKLWNNLLHVKTAPLAEFKSVLKTHLFTCAFNLL